MRNIPSAMMMPQQYPRGYQYPSVQQIPRSNCYFIRIQIWINKKEQFQKKLYYHKLSKCHASNDIYRARFAATLLLRSIISGYVDPGGFLPVQQSRPTQVLQISLPPNMNPQTAPRLTINSRNQVSQEHTIWETSLAQKSKIDSAVCRTINLY